MVQMSMQTVFAPRAWWAEAAALLLAKLRAVQD